MSSTDTSNKTKIWGLAAAAGVLAFLALKFLASYTFWPALLLAVLIAVLVAILLWIGFYRDPEAEAYSGAGSSDTQAQRANLTSGTVSTATTGIAAPSTVTEPPSAKPVETIQPAPAAAAATTAKPVKAEKPAATPAAKPAKAKAPKAAAKPAKKAAAKPASALMGDAGNKMVAEKKAAKAAPRKKTAAKSSDATAATTTAAAPKPAKPRAAKAAAPKAAPKAAAKPAAAKAAPAKPAAAAAGGKPEMLKAARAGGPDDLKQIKGVGPKLERELHKIGVYHFDQVANWKKKEVDWMDENLEGVRGRVSRDEWVKQAKVLAKGGATEFSARVKKGGVY